jgi:flavodoxin
MNTQVAYYSVTGNTRKVAESIAMSAGCQATAIGQGKIDGEKIDLLFLGAAVYATHQHGIHEAVKKFIADLDPARIKKVALFSTGFIQSEAIPMMRRLLATRGIKVAAESYFCLGRFALFNMGHPNVKELEAAGTFAKKTMES